MGKWIEVQVEPSFTVSSIVLRLAQVGGNVINPLQANISLVCFKTSVGFSEEIFPSSHSLPNVKLQKFQKLQTSNQHVLSLPSLSPKSRCFQVGLPPSKNPKSQRRQKGPGQKRMITTISVPQGVRSWRQCPMFVHQGQRTPPSAYMVPSSFLSLSSRSNFLHVIILMTGVYHGTYSLANDHSPFCPEDSGYSGPRLYSWSTKTPSIKKILLGL